MMTRKDFVRSCAAALCATGMCGATSLAEAQSSEETNQPCDAKEITDTRNRSDAASYRFSKLITVLESRVPATERKQILHTLGAACSATYRASLIDRYKGNLRGFLEEGRRNWMAEADYNEATGVLRIVDKGPSCSCPMVKVGATPGSFCDCTLGWQEATYSAILGRPVKAELEESILRGGKRCVYRITLT